jgi:hypothetical protein
VACSEEDLPPPPLHEGNGTGSTDGGGDGPLPEDPPGNEACREADPDAGDGTDTGGGFKFDVGAEDGGGFDFPVTCEDVDASDTNLGCVFWAVDLPNDSRGTDMSPPAADQQFAIVVANASSLESANVSVYLGAEAETPLSTVEVPVDGTHVFELDPQSIDPLQNSYDGVAFRVESDVPITAYQFNPLDNEIEVYSNDASLLFPDHAMAKDYTSVTGNAVLLGMSPDDPDAVNAGAFISVVGMEDGTLVDIFPTAALYDGPVKDVIVDRGRVVTFLSDGTDTGNLSGTRIATSRPAAVFSGNVATIEPYSRGDCCADHLEHQMLPLEAWGTAYAVAAPPNSTGDGNDLAVYRITGAYHDTELEYCPTPPPGAPQSVGAYETATFETNRSFTVFSKDDDKPFAITQFIESTVATGRDDMLGDPAMIALPAALQFQRKYVFAVPSGYEVDFVTVVSRGLGDVELDGSSIPDEDFSDLAVLAGVLYRYAHVEVGPGSHTIESTVPIGITVVGYDTAVSYGFPGGLGLKVIAIPPNAG